MKNYLLGMFCYGRLFTTTIYLDLKFMQTDTTKFTHALVKRMVESTYSNLSTFHPKTVKSRTDRSLYILILVIKILFTCRNAFTMSNKI